MRPRDVQRPAVSEVATPHAGDALEEEGVKHILGSHWGSARGYRSRGRKQHLRCRHRQPLEIDNLPR